MTSDRAASRKKISGLVAQGKVTPREARALYAALDDPHRRARWRALLDPFDDLHGPLAGGLVGLSMLLQVVMSRLGARFDGAIDVHVATFPSWTITFVELALDLGVVSLLAWGIAKALGSAARIRDVVITVGVSRLPLVVLAMPLVAAIPDPASLRAQALTGNIPLLPLLLGIAGIPLLVWSMVLMFRGLRTASGLAGPRAWGLFLATVLVGELVTKLALIGIG